MRNLVAHVVPSVPVGNIISYISQWAWVWRLNACKFSKHLLITFRHLACWSGHPVIKCTKNMTLVEQWCLGIIDPVFWQVFCLLRQKKALKPSFLFCLILKGLNSVPCNLILVLLLAFCFVFFSESEAWANSAHIISCNSQFSGEVPDLGF